MSASLLRWRALVFPPVATLMLWTAACERPLGMTAPAAPQVAGDPGTFVPTGSLATGRSASIAVRLADGRVLVAGGGADNTRLASAELFQPPARPPAGTR